MSVLNSLFNRASFGVRCKTCLNLSISRLKLLRNKREVQLKHMRKEIAQLLQTGQEPIARIRVEHVIREQNILAAYDIVELFCEFVLARIPILEVQRECPSELQEAVASIIFASPRCSDMPELMQIRNLFTTKYGKEFVLSASELRPDSSVNRTIIEKLSVGAPSSDLKLKVMRDIAQEHNLDWDSSATEAEFSKKHEDLLDGLNLSNSKTAAMESLLDAASNKEELSVSPAKANQNRQSPELAAPLVNAAAASRSTTSVSQTSPKKVVNSQREGPKLNDEPVPNCTSDVLERARAAIALAERASAAARTAAELVNCKLDRQASSDKPCK